MDNLLSLTASRVLRVSHSAGRDGVKNNYGWSHTGQRLHIVGTIGKKLSKVVFTKGSLYFFCGSEASSIGSISFCLSY